MSREARIAGPRPDRSPIRSREAASPTKIASLRRPIHEAPMLSATSKNNHSLFPFDGRNGLEDDEIGDSTTGSFDFLPSVSFDDLQSSLESASNELELTQFPSLTGRGNMHEQHADGNTAERSNVTNSGVTTRVAIQPPPGSRASRTSSIMQRPSASNRQSVSSVGPNPTVPNAPTAPAVIRTRRLSHYPPVSNSNLAKPPRKSAGPGSYDGYNGYNETTRSSLRRRPSLALTSERSGSESARQSLDGSARAIVGDRSVSSSRASKARSVQPPPRASQTLVTDDCGTKAPNHNRMSSAFPRSNRASLKPQGPSLANKRLSVLPGVHHASHATGLGARTISPTDTRRMRRMSTAPQIPLPNPPPTGAEARANSGSPSVLPPKTSTPSSSRTTPDPNRKSYSSGLSVASNTSYNTVRTSTGSIQARIPQSASSSRLPAPKALTLNNGQSTGEEDEDVPPVPAIPKVYESPKDGGDTAFLDKRRSNLAIDAGPISSTASLSGPVHDTAVRGEGKPSNRKSIHVSKLDPEKKGPGTQGKKNLQPLRLPPITIGPLSTPTAQKIAALKEQPAEDSPTPLSPRARQTAKTPTTPMTASKSTFFSRLTENKSDRDSIRSSSSVQPARSETPTPAPDGTTSTRYMAIPPSAKDAPRSVVSPFLSSSMPKGGHFEAAMAARSKTGGGYTLPLDTSALDVTPLPKPFGPRAPAAKMTPADASKSPPPMSPEEPPTPSSISSLRRKLSLSWKRSASKAGGNQPPHEDKKQNGVRHESMPPPKLPASATMNALSSSRKTSPTPSAQSNGTTSSYLESRRRKSSASSLNTIMAQENHNDSLTSLTRKETNLDTVVEDSTAGQNASAVRKTLRPKASVSSVRATDVWTAELDKDDLVAEEEMKKLGSRRKETELAARTLDALRKRATAKECVSADEAIRMANLNIFERGEIVDHKDVYFCGTQNAAKVAGDVQSTLPNYGYDDERGDYTIVPGDHLAYRYEVIDVLGKGSFGQVVRCIDHKTGGLVAVKIIRNKKRFHQQAIIEVKILQKLRDWDPKNKHSMVSFTHSFYFRGHLCISTELLDMNLYEFIKSNAFRGFSLKLVRRFTKQLLSSLNLLKQHKVIHCDLKPENILLKHPLHSEIKMIDFGSSCFENEKVYTYIQSRFYRSPEVILGMTYGMPIDMWSVGCILAELYTGVPIFPGENEQEQLACIMEVFGPPEKHLIEKATRKKIFFDSMGKPRLTVSSKGRRRRPSSKTLQQVLKCDDEPFIDFISRCLRWDPDRRMRPDEAIRHEFITGQKTSVPVPARNREPSPTKQQRGGAARPLPEPPGATKLRSRGDASPMKATGGGARRVSAAVLSQVKRSTVAAGFLPSSATTSHVSPATTGAGGNLSSSFTMSNLPRAANGGGRGGIGTRPDAATAGATAAMSTRRNPS